MSLYVSPERKEEGKAEFQRALGQQLAKDPSRRDFIKGLLAGGGAAAVGAAAYFGYKKLEGKPVRAGLIGCGDEGGVLITQHNPEFLRFVAVADIRPSNQKRIFEGESPWTHRQGFKRLYGANAEKEIKIYDDYKKLLEDPNIEAVVIALPLHLHAQASIDAMKAGKHVLCEKLMAWNVSQCKDMIHTADETGKILAIGHQRHYSLLYAHAVEVLKAGELGEVKHIRALWHRNNSWPKLDDKGKPMKDANGHPLYHDGWYPDIPKADSDALQERIRSLGYKSMEELVRWRLYNRTGGGLMAELGSHQLDACSIFLNKDLDSRPERDVHPLAVSGVGTKSFYRDEYKAGEREVDDHVFCTFEFPGPKYYKKKDDKGNLALGADGKPLVDDKDDVVVVTYSSINTNRFEPYGECVMGTHGSLVVETEQSIMLYPERNPNGKATTVTMSNAGGGQTAADSSGSTGVDPAKIGALSMGSGPISRGYREEMEHFAYCIRMLAAEPDETKKWQTTMKCHGWVAMADAIVALTANLAMHPANGGPPQRIVFDPEWFDARSGKVPDPELKPEAI
jgi:predicted dehydrogenase